MEGSGLSDFQVKALRFQFWHTAVMTIPLGLLSTFFPGTATKMLKMEDQNGLIVGISGSVWLAFGLLSLRGIREPAKWSPLLALQFLYKVIWFTCVLSATARRGEFELEQALPLILGFTPFVAADLVAVPWKFLFRAGNTSD